MTTDVKNALGKSSHALAWSVAAVIATSLGLLYTTEKGKEIREDLSDKAKDLAKGFKKTRENVQEYVKDIWGKVSDELEQSYVEVKSEVMAAVEEAKDKMDEKKYSRIVDDIVEKYSEGKKWSTSALKKLKDNLKTDWNDLKSDFETATK
ncbi:MAG: YtxH domain-containing protein [Patescibacteria group bacterium]